MFIAGTFSPYMSKLPDYLESTSFKNPEDSAKNLFQFATQTELNFFDWLHTQPRQLDIFSAAMAASSARQEGPLTTKVSGLFPADGSEHRVLMVDVGGGRGQILNALRKNREDLKGLMIVQDLPREIDGRQSSEEVQGMAYDFFTPQPVQAAHTYFFRHIFHDWPDQSCREILLNTIPAMKPNYSRIVIMDHVIPSTGASAFSSLLDINMITLAGIERTDGHWRKLLEGVGLKVLYIEVPLMGDGVIEAVLADGIRADESG
ncbi:MAG: hypothetical protein ALECFALPRED_009355 [Alectoria fallacina]|uniref:O-methyltransferase C-terminal domain-containing protein n=1 Tax=Alectoria fallacina TaxID=1903189 RepID=A0A8H3PIU0_9LECA|nr:MAG: hypothetical protein ALECFALPRED_009355 [Alectoria fallacina]